MNGKILKISNNDLYGNVDDRKVVVFAAFNHKKYMNKYIIFSFLGEYNKRKLYFGSLHLKEKSLVTFSVKDNTSIECINKFIEEYLSNTVDTNEYQILDISSTEKIEIISYNDMEFDKLDLLDSISIKREEVRVEENNKKSKNTSLYILLFLLIALACGLTYFYFNPSVTEYKKLDCNMTGYNKKVDLNFDSSITIKFDKKDNFKSIERVDVYKFDSEEEYLKFKEENNESKLNVSNGGYKYDDENRELRIISNDRLIIDSYSEIYEYYKNEGYSCIEGTYNG